MSRWDLLRCFLRHDWLPWFYYDQGFTAWRKCKRCKEMQMETLDKSRDPRSIRNMGEGSWVYVRWPFYLFRAAGGEG